MFVFSSKDGLSKGLDMLKHRASCLGGPSNGGERKYRTIATKVYIFRSAYGPPSCNLSSLMLIIKWYVCHYFYSFCVS